ncbi:MAG: GGDEF domain-containing protein [Xanthomonadales bacterium]|nr:GGDEF domain-containing protein [Xanthomonadales bacterium]
MATDDKLQALQGAVYQDPQTAPGAIDAALAEGWLKPLQGQLLLARALYQRNEFQASLQQLAIAEPMLADAGIPLAEAQLQTLVAQNFYRMGSMDQAMVAALAAERGLGQTDDRPLRAQIHNIMAAVQLASGDHGQARQHFERSLALFEAEGSQVDIAKLRNNLGALLIEDGDLDAAEPHLQASLALARVLGRTTTLIPNLVNLSELHARRGEHAQARAAVESCFQTSAEAADESQLVWCHQAASFQLQAAGELHDAILQARQALALAERFGLQQHIVELARALAAMLAQLNQHEEAAAMNDKAFVTMNAIRDQLLRLRLEQSAALIDYERARAEVRSLQLQADFRQRIQSLLWLGLLLLLPLLLASLWLLRARLRALGALARANQRNAELALTDSLTGLPNRRAMLQQLDQLDAEPATVTGGYALALIDADHFKRLNDRHGHEEGDRALCRIADVLRVSVPAPGMVARWGGEEFVALFPGVWAQQAGRLCEQALARLRLSDAQGIGVTVSIGIAQAEGRCAREVIAAADAAMYRAKQAGRDRVVEAGLDAVGEATLAGFDSPGATA